MSPCVVEKKIFFGVSAGALVTSLHELDRLDAAEVVLRSAPLFKVIEPVVV